MAYSTGSAANINELLTALKDFATAQGWTIDKWTSGSNLLFMHKSSCYVAFQGATASTTYYATGSTSSSSFTDTVLRAALSTSFTTALTTYNSHPGSIVTTATDNDRIEVNDLVGPFSAYHFFSGDESAGDPPYIMAVVQTATDRFQHFGFGMIDKKGFTHSGAAFLVGCNRVYFRTVSTLDLTNTSYVYNDPSKHAIPYDGSVGNPYQSCATIQIYVPDALPTSWSAPAIISNYQIAAGTPGPMGLISRAIRPSSYGTSDYPRLLSNVIASPISQWAGNVTLWPLPIIHNNLTQSCYIGDYPNVRMVNMDSLGPGSEITYGSDTWKIFPSMTQRAWGLDRLSGLDGVSTGQYGVAYKKVA